MRIAIFTDTYHPEINGVVTSIDTYRRQLVREGHDVYVFAPRYFGLPEDDDHVIRFPSIPFPFPLMKERRISGPGNRGFRRFGQLNIDIIHSQVPAFAGILALIASWWWRVPHVHTYHTHYMEYIHYMPFPHSLATRGVIWIATRYCGRCQGVVVPSVGMKQEVESYGVDAPVTVIPTGISPTNLDGREDMESILRRYHVSHPDLAGKRLLVSVGRLGREKNIGFLIQVIKRLKERKHDIHFLMIGDGPDRAEIEAEIDRLGVRDCITLTGYLDRHDVLSVIREGELFIFASTTETQGLVLLESMAMGTPVVAIRGTGIEDLVNGNIGGVATADDLAEFTDEVEALLLDNARMRQKQVDALVRAREWSAETLVKRLLSVYVAAIQQFKLHGLPRFRHRQRY